MHWYSTIFFPYQPKLNKVQFYQTIAGLMDRSRKIALFLNENSWKFPTCPLVLWDHNQRASKYSRKSPSSPSKDLPHPPELKKCSKNPGTVVSPPRPQLNSLNCRAMPQHTSTRQDEIVFSVRSMRDEIANKCHSGPKEKGGGGNSSCLSSIILHKLDICPFCSELKF